MPLEASWGNTKFGETVKGLGFTKAALGRELDRSRSDLEYWFRTKNTDLRFVLELANYFGRIPIVFFDNNERPVLSIDDIALDPAYLIPYVNRVLPVVGARHNYRTKVKHIEELAEQRELKPHYLMQRDLLQRYS